MRPDTARHPALTLTLHRRPQRRKTYPVGFPGYEVTRGIARWLVDHFLLLPECGESSVNRSRTFSYECEIPDRNKYQTKIVGSGEITSVYAR